MSHVEDRPSRPRLSLLRGAPLVAALCASSCASPASPPRAPAIAAAGTARADASARVADAPRSAPARAQRSWCGYLERLYQRATEKSAPWPRHAECLEQRSNASAEMLERTATCADRALTAFTGDPISAEYAAEVRRCGSEALDALALGPAALEPFLEAICRRAQTCDGAPYDDCRAGLAPPVAARLGRAIGALGDASRARLLTCIGASECSDTMGERLTGCLEPIMERLLWLPTPREH